MTTPDNSTQEAKPVDKELNFRQLETKYQRQLEQERSARLDAEQRLQQMSQPPVQEDDDESDPYVDHRKLAKKLASHESKVMQQTQGEIHKAVQGALYEERKQNWMKTNQDFYDVMKHADKLAMKDPELAETILEMPEGFERQKLVYKNIKALGLHVEQAREPSIQEKIDQNKRSPFYQPSGTGTSPYKSTGDFSKGGQKQAYEKMQELKDRLRL